MALEQVLQAETGQVLHDVKEGAVVGAAVVEDFDGVPVREPSGHADLALEAGQDVRIAGLIGVNQLDGARAFEHAVLGQVDLAHAAGAERLHEAVLAELLGFEDLAAQRVDQVRADHGRDGRDESTSTCCMTPTTVIPSATCGYATIMPATSSDRCERHGADHDRGAPPGVRDEHPVSEDEQQPKGQGRGHDTAASILHGHAVLQHQKKRGGQAEDDQLRRSEAS